MAPRLFILFTLISVVYPASLLSCLNVLRDPAEAGHRGFYKCNKAREV